MTVTLDEDVVERLKALARRRNTSFSSVLTSVVRAGLSAAPSGAEPYVTPSRAMRLRPGADIERALQLAAALEDEEIARKLDDSK
jgi:hypothetical protein